jgi:NDP-sugar pyrophosphorylase family protein
MSNYQIIIPMSGFGERFRKAGYTLPKPLIDVDGKPIITHLVNLFPEESDFIFICNQEHLDHPDYKLREVLNGICPSGRILGIEPHKLGPIHAVLQAQDLISLDKQTIVNYCDFACYWDWADFKNTVQKTQCAGAIPAYKGFHPHSLGSTNYAYMLEKDGWVQDIQEKQPYTDNRMNEYASSGTYYFASGKVMLNAFHSTVEDKLDLNGEYYVSLAYKSMLAKKMPVSIYPIDFFMQWGTPDDLEEYQGWHEAFKQLLEPDLKPEPYGNLIIPMAGLGQRFSKEGYKVTKPLIPVSGKPMVLQASHDLPPSKNQMFVLRRDMPGLDDIQHQITRHYPDALFHIVDQVTDGQATTTLIGLESLMQHIGNSNEPITVGACDNGALYDRMAFDRLQKDPSVDVIVWAVRKHANAARHPQMFGWINVDQDGNIKNVSVKTPLASPATDPIVIGTFTFKNADVLKKCIESLKQRDGKVNGEFYLDSCINDAIALGMSCKIFEVDHYISWGTPNDLRTFEYWQNCFNQWGSHSYSLLMDSRVKI